MIGYDNAEGQGDHRHEGNTVRPYSFKGLRRLTKDFLNDIQKIRGKIDEDQKN